MKYNALFIFLLFAGAMAFAQSSSPATPRILLHPAQIDIVRLDSLNSSLRETNLSISPDGRFLYFMSDRGGQRWSSLRGGFRGKPHYDGDIWYSEREKSAPGIVRQWSHAQCLSGGINTGSGEDEPNISQDGQAVYFQSWRADWQMTGGPYYVAQLRGNEWEQPRGLGGGIADYFRVEFNKYNRYATDGMSVSADGRKLIVAAGVDYDGDMDILVSTRNRQGRWSYPKKLPISTPQDERSVFLAADSRTLYFASDGYGGKGGLDIFKTVLNDDGTIGEIVNIGEPFNTPQDDYGFILTASGNEAYFVRNGDIYFADLRRADEDIKPLPVHLVSGRVTDATTKKGIEASLYLLNEDNAPVSSAHSNAVTGEYSMVLPARKGTFRQVIVSGNYDTLRSTIELQDENRFKETTRQFTLKKTNEPLLILFDFDSFTLKEEYAVPLEALAAKLKTGQKVVLSGHTDSKGDETYNLGLSQHRVAQVKKYLLGKGLKENDILIEYRGEDDPAISNRTDNGRARNRRVEVEIR